MGGESTAPALRPDELGERAVVLSTDHDDAIDRVTSAFTDAGFRVATTFSPSERIRHHHDAELAPYHVLGFGVPAAGDHALAVADERVGALFPCNVVVWEDDAGRQHVYHLNTMRIAPRLDLAPDDGSWGALVAQIERMVDEAFEELSGETGS